MDFDAQILSLYAYDTRGKKFKFSGSHANNFLRVNFQRLIAGDIILICIICPKAFQLSY